MRAAWFFVPAVAVGLIASGGCARDSKASHETTVQRLQSALARPVDSAEVTSQHNNLVRDVVESGALEGKFRDEIKAKLGEGTSCRDYDMCAKKGFDEDDWYYYVGVAPALQRARIPVLIVGFDATGRVAKTSYVRMD